MLGSDRAASRGRRDGPGKWLRAVWLTAREECCDEDPGGVCPVNVREDGDNASEYAGLKMHLSVKVRVGVDLHLRI